MGRTVFLVIDSGGVVGAFSDAARAEAAVKQLAATAVAWRPAIFPWRAASLGEDSTRLAFVFPVGSTAFPIAVGTPEAMAALCGKLSQVGIAAEGDSDFYQADLDTSIPAAVRRIRPGQLEGKALEAFTKMVMPPPSKDRKAEDFALTIAEMVDHDATDPFDTSFLPVAALAAAGEAVSEAMATSHVEVQDAAAAAEAVGETAEESAAEESAEESAEAAAEETEEEPGDEVVSS